MQLAEEVARLADVAERMLERDERAERRQHAEQLERLWGPTPQRVTMGTFLSAIPGLAAKFDKTVPDEFVAQTDDGELTVACPCGAAPAVGTGKLAGCDCGRWFLSDGHSIHVALSPTTAAATDSDQSVAAEVAT